MMTKMNIKDWEKQFDKKFTRKSKGLESKGKYMDSWFVRETTAEELKVFIHQLLSQSNQEIVKETLERVGEEVLTYTLDEQQKQLDKLKRELLVKKEQL